jgi:predicted 3-demethylubiquinone-9 3-methyltransferase (glyoxalase superfamily)
MRSSPVVPCLWFDDQAQQVAEFYTQTFPRGRMVAVSHYPKSADTPSGKPGGSVLTVEFELAGQRFTALNGGPQFVIGPNISFFAHVYSVRDADRLFAKLADGGIVLMPIDTYPWSERYGWVQDRFGVSWQVMMRQPGQSGATIVACLMFAGAVHGEAEQAMQTYARIFPDGRIVSLERYADGEGPVGTIKHGRFVIAGQEMVAMDSHVNHDAQFNEAVSLQVMCKDQQEIDRYWDALSEGGEKGPCGWLKDRFGVSWQIVPIGIDQWMASKDETAKDRAFAAMMKMTKLDIAVLEAAFRQSET